MPEKVSKSIRKGGEMKAVMERIARLLRGMELLGSGNEKEMGTKGSLSS